MATIARLRHGAAILSVPAALVLVVAACGVAASPLASPPSPTPVATLSPSVDPAKGFLARAVDVQANGTATVGGTVTAGASSGQIEGEFAFDGHDNRSRLAVDIGGVATVTERIEHLGRAWMRTLPGPWLVDDDPPGNDRTLAATLAAITSVEDVGVETRNGRALHRLRPEVGSPIPPETFGLGDPAITDPEITLDSSRRSSRRSRSPSSVVPGG